MVIKKNEEECLQVDRRYMRLCRTIGIGQFSGRGRDGEASSEMQ